MINIKDKVSLRQVALDMAMRRYHDDSRNTSEIIKTADTFATYIQGGAKLEEFKEEIHSIQVNNNYYGDDCIDDDVNDFLN